MTNLRAHPLRPRTTVPLVLAFASIALAGASPFPGGCGSDVKQSKTYVTQNCDTIVNGKAPPGCGSTADQSCDTIENGRPPPGCDQSTPKPSPNCPDSAYPLDCGNGFCCPSGFPVCCGDSKYCGTDASACLSVDDPGGGGSSSSGNNGAGVGSGPSGGGFTCSSQSVQCFTVQFCADSSGNQCYYQANGQRFNCNSCSDITSCFNAAVNVGVQSCSG